MKQQKKIVLSLATTLILVNSVYAKESTSLDAITVTANKMEENIKDIPQSITVMTDVEIEERGIKSVSDLIEFIPNLNSTGTVNFRGLNSSMFTNASPMTIYVDGVPYTHRWGFDKALSNIERVEVLRGPQGSIYGKDSMGGVINIVTKDPSNELTGSVSAEYGSHNTKEVAFDISTPLIDDKLFLGISGFNLLSDGDATNHYPGQKKNANEKEQYFYNAKLIYNPTDNLSIKFNASKDKNTRHGPNGGVIPAGKDIKNYKRDDFKDLSYDEDKYGEDESGAQRLQVDYDFDGMTFSSLTTNKISDNGSYNDSDLSDDSALLGAKFFMTHESKNISQEFRLTNNSEGLRWVTGIYFENQKDDILVATRAPLKNANMDAISETTSDTMATFGQVVIPFLKDYELTLGGRYQRIKKGIESAFHFPPQGAAGDPAYSLDEDNTWNAFLPKIALSYKINNDLNSYLSVSQGYLAGGYNYFARAGTVEQNKFDAQKSTSYELGMRGDLLDNSLYLSAALFYMDIKDIHVYSHDAETQTTFTSNAAEAHSQGIELELGYTINDNWRIDSALGLIESKFDKYTKYTRGVGTDMKDKNLIKTPSHTANIGISYFNDNGIYGRFDIKNQGKMYFDDENKKERESYTLANIKAGYLLDDWEFYGYVNNISDENYFTSVNNHRSGGTMVSFGEGRFIGIGTKYTF